MKKEQDLRSLGFIKATKDRQRKWETRPVKDYTEIQLGSNYSKEAQENMKEFRV